MISLMILHEFSCVWYEVVGPQWLSCKEPGCQSMIRGYNPWIGKILGEGNGNPLQYSCLENPMDRRVW